MRVINVSLSELETKVLMIGFQGENEITQVRIDAAEILTDYPNATPTLIVKPLFGFAYPVIVTQDGTNVVWEIDNSVLSFHGDGEIQLTFTAGTVIAKSYVGRIRIKRSLSVTGEAPDPIETWEQAATAKLAEVDAQIGELEDMVEAAEAAKDQAQDIVDDAAADIQAAGATQIAAVQAKGTEVLNSIPSDYTELSDDVSVLKGAINVLEPAATSSDVGKALIAKTVSGGKVTSYEFGETGGADPEVIEQAVYDWLDEHPEATTTVEDGSITRAKIADGVLNYVTPEDFGAVGDGVTDDTTAVQAALDYGRTNNTAVRGFKVYKTTDTLTISGSYMDVDIHRLNYTGSSNALTVKGSYHQLRFGSIYCNSGAGVIYKADTVSVFRNNFTAGRIYCANGHCVDLQGSNSYSIYYNTFNIRDVSSDTGNCYNGNDLREGENVYYNSSCHCQNGWAIYHLNGKFYNFALEGDVLNGICLRGGYSYYAGFRIRELVDKLVRRMSGLDPTLQGGTLIKYDDANYCISKFVCDDFVPYDAVDVSTMITPEAELAKANPDVDVLRRLTYYNEIDAPIRVGYYGTYNGYFTPGHKMIIQGGRKICVPDYEVEHTIIDAEYDLRDPIIDAGSIKIYPTRMVIGVDDCEIYLPSSYNPVGYSSFIVDQSAHTCTIYDYNDDENPIFDGESYGNGIYRLTAYTDLDDNAIQKNNPSSSQKQFDSSNYYWKVEQINNAGGGSSCGVVSVADYGAVGDGVTDDSQAVQDACDAGYDVYFESNKTYYLASTVTIDHNCHLHGGENTVIKTKTPSGGSANSAFVVSGTLKKTTTLTSDYTTTGSTANCGNQFTLSDMTGIEIGDILVIKATDQYYSYARNAYYLGATLLVSDIYDSHIYTSDSMPWGITNTANVSVKVYSAPTVIIENLGFVSDYDGVKLGAFQIQLTYCKNSIVRNCNISQMNFGLDILYSVNSLVDCVTVSKSKYDNSLSHDGYGIKIDSSTNTIVKRVLSICAQGCLDMGGDIPNLNTYVYNCNLSSECRAVGIDMHENSYNLVVEDCTLGGASFYGTVLLNRCRIIQNVRGNSVGISLRGSHKSEWANFKITNCQFDDGMSVQVTRHSPQSPIQAFENTFGNIMIENCEGGYFSFTPDTNSTITANVIKRLILNCWKNCDQFSHGTGTKIEYAEIVDTNFVRQVWINKQHNGSTVYLDGIEYLNIYNDHPKNSRSIVNITSNGGRYVLPGNTDIVLSSSDSSAYYIVCGNNLASNNLSDYVCGSVGGNNGDSISFSPIAILENALTKNSDGNLVLTMPSNYTGGGHIYTKCLAYVPEASVLNVSCLLKDTGSVTGQEYRIYIAIVDCNTGKITYKDSGSKVEATPVGATVTHHKTVNANSLVLCYLSIATGIASAETTFEDFVARIEPIDMYDSTSPVAYEEYTGSSRTGDGTLKSVSGLNYIMSSATDFSAKIKADFISNPIGAYPTAVGVSF